MKVFESQSMLDVASYSCGSAEAVFDLAVKNGLSVTDSVMFGDELSEVSVINIDVAEYLQERNIMPCTFASIQVKEFNAEEYSASVAHIVASTSTVSNYTVEDSQSLLDVTVCISGSVECLYELAVNNGVSVSSILTAGTSLQKVDVQNQKIFNYYSEKNIVPATDTPYTGTPTGEFEISEFSNEEFYV